MEPFFRLGEIIKALPSEITVNDVSGIWEVEDMFFNEDTGSYLPPRFNDSSTILCGSRGWKYKLKDCAGVSKSTGEMLNWFDESSLRKNHNPSSISFEEIMNSASKLLTKEE